MAAASARATGAPLARARSSCAARVLSTDHCSTGSGSGCVVCVVCVVCGYLPETAANKALNRQRTACGCAARVPLVLLDCLGLSVGGDSCFAALAAFESAALVSRGASPAC